mgnify:CR=1 FL=1|jgi:hypothetical protein
MRTEHSANLQGQLTSLCLMNYADFVVSAK